MASTDGTLPETGLRNYVLRGVPAAFGEAALLTGDEKIAACTLAKSAGADFVKTSTGFGSGGATTADVALIRRVVGPQMGIKAAGGIRDLAALKAMVAAGATRIGTSAGVRIVRESNEKGRTP